MQALGFIETKGLVAALEGADAMLKAADVCLVERTYVKSGIVAITITGDVAACKASIDAAAAAIEKMGGTLLSKHVIPRPHESLEGLMVGAAASNGRTSGMISQQRPSEEQNDEPEKTEVNRIFVEEMIRSNGIDRAFSRLKRVRLSEIKGLICHEYPELGMNEKAAESLTKKELLERLNEFYMGAELGDSRKKLNE